MDTHKLFYGLLYGVVIGVVDVEGRRKEDRKFAKQYGHRCPFCNAQYLVREGFRSVII